MFGIKALKAELAQAERGNETLRGVIARLDAESESAKADARFYSDQYEVMKWAFHSAKEARQQLERTRVQQQEIIEQHVRNEKDLNRVLSGRDANNRALAAERDEAVLRARNLDKRWSDCQNKLAEAQIALQTAMVRDPKTGRLTKWVDKAAAEDHATLSPPQNAANAATHLQTPSPDEYNDMIKRIT